MEIYKAPIKAYHVKSVTGHTHGDLSFTKSRKVTERFKDRRATPFDYLQIIRNDPRLKDDFFYCNRVGEAYDFEFVSYEKRSGKEYLTISSRGVTHFVKGEVHFLTLDQWEREYHIFNKLKKIQFFRQYKLAKSYHFWKNFRRRSMMIQKASVLN